MRAIAELAKDALELPADQRRKLTLLLLDLAEGDQGFSPEVEAEWEDELCRRLQAVEAGAAQTRSLDEVFADLDRRFPS